MSRVSLLTGDVADKLAATPANSFDAVFCDPPYGLSKQPDMAEVMKHWLAGDDYKHRHSGFMGRAWDSFVPGPATWKEVYRVLKPGGHALVFAGTRTLDLMGLSLRLAGFEIRDCFAWLYGQGFPKSLSIHKTLDDGLSESFAGYGTALKPAHEPILVVMKPVDGTFANNALKYGVSGMNINGTRIPANWVRERGEGWLNSGVGKGRPWHGSEYQEQKTVGERVNPGGRFPTNVILQHHPDCSSDGGCYSDCPIRMLDEQGGDRSSARASGNPNNPKRGGDQSNVLWGMEDGRESVDYRDTGGASRFFYNSKVSKSERNRGCEKLNWVLRDGTLHYVKPDLMEVANSTSGVQVLSGNPHPTVKPVDLCKYLATLILPPKREDASRCLLVPFSGSGSEIIGALLAGWDKVVGIELDPSHNLIAAARIKGWEDTPLAQTELDRSRKVPLWAP